MGHKVLESITINRSLDDVRRRWKQGVGVARFEEAPAGRGTRVEVAMDYEVPKGLLAKLLRPNDPRATLHEALRRFKQELEAGEVPTTKGQPQGARSLSARPQR